MKENDVIWVSIEESDKYELSNYGFVRNKYTKKVTGTIGECAKFLGVKPYIINNALRKDNMGVFKFIVINDKIE